MNMRSCRCVLLALHLQPSAKPALFGPEFVEKAPWKLRNPMNESLVDSRLHFVCHDTVNDHCYAIRCCPNMKCIHPHTQTLLLFNILEFIVSRTAVNVCLMFHTLNSIPGMYLSAAHRCFKAACIPIFFFSCTTKRHQLANHCARLWTLWEAARVPAEKPGRGTENMWAAHRKASSRCHQTPVEGRRSSLSFIHVRHNILEASFYRRGFVLTREQRGFMSHTHNRLMCVLRLGVAGRTNNKRVGTSSCAFTTSLDI